MQVWMQSRWYIAVVAAGLVVVGAHGNVIAASARAWASITLTQELDAVLRESNNTVSDLANCSAELAKAKSGLKDAVNAIEAARKDVEQSEKGMKQTSGRKSTLQKRVDAWKERLSAHSKQIGQLGTLVTDFAAKLKIDQQGIVAARARLKTQMATIREREEAHNKNLKDTAITQQAVDRMKNFPMVDNWRLAGQESALEKKRTQEAATSAALKTAIQDAKAQEVDIKAREASWVNNRQILAGMMQYLDWSRDMFVQQRRGYDEEAQELDSVSDLFTRRDKEFAKAQQDLKDARVGYGQAVQHLIKEQDEEVEAMRAAHLDTIWRLTSGSEEDKKHMGEEAAHHEAVVKAALEKHERELGSKLGAEMMGTKKRHALEIERLKARHAIEVAAREAHHHQVLRSKMQHIDDLKEAHAQQMADMKAQAARTRDELKDEQSLHKEDINRTSEEMKDMQSMHSTSVEALKEQHSQHLNVTLDTHMKHLDAMKEQHREELDSLKGEHTNQLDTLKEQHDANQDRVDEQHDLHIKDLQDEHADQLKSMEEDIAAREDEIAKRDEHIGEMMRLQSTSLEAFQAGTDTAEHTHSAEVMAVREQSEAALAANEDTINRLVERQSQEIAARDTAIANLEKAIGEHRSEIKSQTGVIVQNAATVGALKEAMKAGGKAMDEVQNAFKSTRDNLCRCMKRGEDLEEHVGAVTGDMHKMSETVGQYKNQNDQLKDSLQQHKEHHDVLSGYVGHYKGLHDHLVAQNGQLKEHLDDHMDANKDLDSENDRLKDHLGQTAQIADKLHDENGQLREHLGYVRNVNDGLASDKGLLSDRMGQYGTLNDDLHKENSALKAQLGQGSAQYDRLNDHLGQYRAQHDLLNKELEQYRYEHDRLTGDLGNYRYQNDQLRHQVGRYGYNPQLPPYNPQLPNPPALPPPALPPQPHLPPLAPPPIAPPLPPQAAGPHGNQPVYNVGNRPYGSLAPNNYYYNKEGTPYYGYNNAPPYGYYNSTYYDGAPAYGANYGNSLAPRWVQPNSDADWLQSRLDYLRQSVQTGVPPAAAGLPPGAVQQGMMQGVKDFATPGLVPGAGYNASPPTPVRTLPDVANLLKAFAGATNLLRSGGTAGASGAADKQAMTPAQVPPPAPVVKPQQETPEMKATGDFRLKIQQLAKIANLPGPGR